MTRIFPMLAIACMMMVLFLSAEASARPIYAAETGKECGFCHIDPNGGGTYTEAGQYYFDNGELPPETVPAPTNLTATAVSSSQIDLAWTDNSSEETGFVVQRATTSGGSFTSIVTLEPNVTTYSHTGLNASTTYYYRVHATSIAGDSLNTNVASAATLAPPVTIPAAPSSLTATGKSSSQIDLAWIDNSSDETNFIIERAETADGVFTEIATRGSNVKAHSDNGLDASTAYYYRVAATNSAGNSEYSNTASAVTLDPPATIPAAPTGLSASAVSSSQIDLIWTDNSSDETGFIVERAASSDGTFTSIATLGSNTTTYSDTGLNASTAYFYRVAAANSAGNSEYSNTASAVTLDPPATIPAAPTGLSASAVSSSQIDLAWTDNSSDETGFIVERAASSDGTFTSIATLGSNTTTYSDTGLNASTAYFYRVAAANSAGNSEYSNTASAVTLDPPATIPAAPTGLSASAVSSSQIDLIWTDNSSDETGFILERAASSDGTFTQIATLGSNTTTYSDTGLNASTAYFYRVAAANSAGNSEYSNTASAVTLDPPATIPADPSDLSATAALSTEIDLSWIDNSSDETGFMIERSESIDGIFTVIATVGAGITDYTDTGLTPSTTYYYRVNAVNGSGNSGYSNIAFDTTSAPPIIIPAAPTGLSASAASSSRIDLTWTDNSSDETGFIVERSTSSDGVFTAIAALGSDATTYNDTGLSASTTYYYRVYAANSAGNSAYSNTASAATLDPPVTIPSAPSGLSATGKSSSRIDLTWIDNSSGETGFIVERATSSDGTFAQIATVGSNVTSYSNTGLNASTTYYYRVFASNSAGNSDYSNTASAATLAAPASPKAPNAPSELKAAAFSSKEINLTWKNTSQNETGFTIERSMSTGRSQRFKVIATLGSGVTTYINTGLSESSKYFYRVRAFNSVGNSGYSNTASAKTLSRRASDDDRGRGSRKPQSRIGGRR